MRNKLKRALALLLTMALLTGLIGMLPAQAAEVTASRADGNTIVVDPTDYGADPSGKTDSAVAIWNALEAAKAQQQEPGNENKAILIDFPEGEYHIYRDYVQQREYHTSNTNSLDNPIKWFGILIEDQKNLTLEGNGSLFVMHGGYMAALGIVRSENIKLHNFSWDYGVPTLSEMTVLATGRTGADGVSGDYYTDYFIPSSNPFHIENGNKMVWESERSPYTGELYWQESNYRNEGASAWACQMYFDPSTNTMIRTDSSPFGGQITKTGENTIRITSTTPRPNIQLAGRGGPAPEAPGMVWAFSRMFQRTTAGAFNWESKDIVVENVNVHYMHGFGWLTEMCENVTYKNCDFMPREGSGRHVTGFADLIHVSGAKGTITVEDCNFSFPQDDHINIHGTFLKVSARNGNTLTAKYIHAQQGGFPQYHVGDKVAITKSNGQQNVGGPDKFYTVKSVVNPFENGNDGRTTQVTFEEDIPAEVYDGTYVLENVTYAPNVVVRDNYFGVLPTRAVLCTTRGTVLFEDNTFVGSTMAPVYISNDAYSWFESGPVRNFTFKNNTVYTRWVGENEMAAAFHVNPVGGIPGADEAIHENITIEGNTFYSDSGRRSLNAVNATSVKGMTIKDNKFLRWDPEITMTLSGGSTVAVGDRLTLTTTSVGDKNTAPVFSFSSCKDVVIEGNTYDDGMNLKLNGDANLITNNDADKGLSFTNNNSNPSVVSNLTYISTNPAVAAVDDSGVVTGLKAGTTKIFACYEWPGGGVYRSNEMEVTVSGEAAQTLEGVVIEGAGNVVLAAAEETRNLTAKLTPEGVTADVVWSVVDAKTGGATDKAIISNAGLLTAKGSGIVTVKAAAKGITAEQTFVISIPKRVPAADVNIADASYGATNGENPANWSSRDDNTLTIIGDEGDIWGAKTVDWGNKAGAGVKNMFLYTLPEEIIKAENGVLAAVKISGLPAKINGWSTANILLFKDVDSYTAIGKSNHRNGFFWVNEVGGNGTETQGNSAQNNETEVWFAFYKHGDSVDTYFKLGSGTWQPIKTGISNAALGQDYKIGFATWKNGTDVTATFSDLHVGAMPVAAPAVMEGQEALAVTGEPAPDPDAVAAAEESGKVEETVEPAVETTVEPRDAMSVTGALDALLETPAIPLTRSVESVPAASSVALDKAAYAQGEAATVSYTYTGEDTEGASLYEWNLTNGGVVTKTRTTAKTYVIPATGSLTCTVYPVDRVGVSGTPVTTSSSSVGAQDSLRLVDIRMTGKTVEGFALNTTEYAVKLPCELSALQLGYTSENGAYGTIELYVDGVKQEGAYANSGSAVLPVEDGSVVELRRVNGTETKSYNLTVEMHKSSDTALTALSFGDLLNVTENPEEVYVLIDEENRPTFDLSVTAAEGVKGIRVLSGYNFIPVADTAQAANEFAANVTLFAGLNPFFITVTAADGVTQKTTMVHVVRSGYANTTATGITVDGQPLEGFAPATLDYDMTTAAESLTVGMTLDESMRQTASITLNGVRTEGTSATVNLKNGMNDIVLAVKAENTVSNGYYTIRVFKPYDGNTNLKTFDLGGMGISPAFNPLTKEYSAQSMGGTYSVNFTAEDLRANLQVTCNGETLTGTGSVSGSVMLYKGTNVLTVSVTAPDGATKTAYHALIEATGSPSYLSDLPWVSATSGWGTVQRDKKVAQGVGTDPIRLAGADGSAVTYEKGIGTNSPSEIIYSLAGKGYQSFHAMVGVDYAQKGQAATVMFKVYLDDSATAVFDSGLMTGNPLMPQKEVNVPLTPDNKKIRLVVEAVENEWFDCVDWADTKFMAEMEERPSDLPVYVTGVSLDQAKLALTQFGTAQLTATITPADATEKGVIWSSDKPAVATVSETGLVTAVGAGTATITGTSKDAAFTASCKVSVTEYIGSGGGSSNTTTKTEKNEDGSTTKTVTDKKTGNVTETTTYPDGAKLVAVTPKDGKTTIEATVPKGKDKVTVTIPTAGQPKSGEVAVIIHEDGKREVIKTSVSTKDGLRVTLTGNAKLEIMDNSKSFSDVPADHWGADAIAFVTSRELFNGGDGGFQPTGEMSRAMLFTVLARLDGQDLTGGETWYSKAMDWAKESGVSDGSRPEASITRESLAVMLYRYAGSPEVGGMALGEFTDAESVSTWASDAMLWCVESGILTGSGGQLNPAATATRAEVAAMLERFIAR